MRVSHLGRHWAISSKYYFRSLYILSALKMPPKKKEEEKPTPLMGRFGTSLKCGIVGLPNVG